MLNNLRGVLRPVFEKIGTVFASTGLSPNFWTGLGLALAFASAIMYGIGDPQYSLIIGGIVLLVSGFFDIVDGQVARITKKSSPRGAFLDSVFDKIAESAIFFGIFIGGYADGYLAFLAIVLSLLVSYARSRAESLNVKLQGIGIGERAERLLIVAIIGIFGFMDYALMIVIIVAGITFVQRIVVTSRNLQK